MRRISIILFLAAFALNCGPSAENTNKPNTNTPTATPTVANNNADSNANTANANVANANAKKDEPVPTFTDAPTAFAEGNKYFDANETEKAIEAYKQAIKLNPDLAEAHFKLGVALALIEREKQEQTELSPTNSSQPTPTPTPTKTIKKGKLVVPETESDRAFAGAVNAYKKIIAKNPKDDVAFFNLGRAYNKLNEDKDAEKSLRQAVRLKPNDSEYQTELGAILIKLAKYDEALGILKKAIKLDESNSQAQDLLEKAQGGKKRTEYGIPKDKPQPPQPK